MSLVISISCQEPRTLVHREGPGGVLDLTLQYTFSLHLPPFPENPHLGSELKKMSPGWQYWILYFPFLQFYFIKLFDANLQCEFIRTFFSNQTLTTTQPHHFYSLAGHCGPPAQLHWNLKTILLQWKLSARLFIRKNVHYIHLWRHLSAINISKNVKTKTVDAHSFYTQIFALHF